ncbi:hypothetical protein AK812_SmicGene42043, partial [Symbiodinium microadriaticum]
MSLPVCCLRPISNGRSVSCPGIRDADDWAEVSPKKGRRPMSLLDAQRQRRRALDERQEIRSASEVVRHLRQRVQLEGLRGDALVLEEAAGTATSGFSASSTSTGNFRTDRLFKTTEKKTNVLEVVRGVFQNDPQQDRSVFAAAEAKDLIIEDYGKVATMLTGDAMDEEKHCYSGVLERYHHLKLQPSTLNILNAMAYFMGDIDGMSNLETIVEELKQLKHQVSGLFGTLFGEGSLGACAACFHAWHLWFQRGHYERNRRRFRESLAWDDPTRAGAVIQARKTLAKSDKVTWLSVKFCRKVTEDAQDQNALYPVTSLPSLRRESGKIFSELAQELREQLSALVESQLEAVSEAEKAVIHRWILREKTKDMQKAFSRDEAATWHLECAKRCLAQSSSLAASWNVF